MAKDKKRKKGYGEGVTVKKGMPPEPGYESNLVRKPIPGYGEGVTVKKGMPPEPGYESNLVRKPMPRTPEEETRVDNFLSLEDDYVAPAKGIGVRPGKGNFSVVKTGQPKGIGAPNSVAGVNAAARPGTPTAATPGKPAAGIFGGIERPGGPGPGGIGTPDAYTQAIQSLQNIGIKASTPHKFKTGLGNELNIWNPKVAVEAEKAIGALVKGVYGEDIAKAKGEAAYKLGIGENAIRKQSNVLAGERTGVMREKTELDGRKLLQEAITGEQKHQSKTKENFLKELKLNMPQGARGPTDVEVGMFRLAFSGASMPNEYKAKGKELLSRFKTYYKQFLKEGSHPDNEESKKTARKAFEAQLSNQSY